MKCKNCGEEIANDSKFCHYCGARVTKEAKKRTVVWLCVAVIILIGVAVVTGIIKNNHNTEIAEEDRVVNTINTLNYAYAANDFNVLAEVYAQHVDRFHDAYHLSKSTVIGKYRKYDSMFGVYGKHINVRWNTLQMNRLSDDELSVVFVEDYTIDRYDKSKYSVFVLEEHLILDRNYKIKSIYDVQLSKSINSNVL